MGRAPKPHVVVFSSLFPSAMQPSAGLFIRQRVFRVGEHLEIAVVAPTPWFPLQGLLHTLRPNFRPGAPRFETQSGVDVWFPRFFSVPGLFKKFDGLLMALCAFSRMRRLRRAGRLDVIDAHFAYPDGYAASLLSRWLKVPYTVTLRGTETRHLVDPALAGLVLRALDQAASVFSVSESLRDLLVSHGANPQKIEVVGNGIDASLFSPQDRGACRTALGLPENAKVLVSVGGLVPRKGFHRVIEVLPELRKTFPDLVYLIVGGGSAEGDKRRELGEQVRRLKLEDCVRFLGFRAPDELPAILSAADVFVLATSNEGWANVFLEAMACGLPVVTTDVGGNREVVCDENLGTVVPFADSTALSAALSESLRRNWDARQLRAYAESNSWDERVGRLVARFSHVMEGKVGQHG